MDSPFSFIGHLAKSSKTFSSEGEGGEEQQKSDGAKHLRSDAVEHQDGDGGLDDDDAVKKDKVGHLLEGKST